MGDIRAEFISRGKATLGLIEERKELNPRKSEQDVAKFLRELDDETVKRIKANVNTSLIFNVIRANYVKFTVDDLVPDDIDEFVSGYRLIKDDETGDDVALFSDATGDDKAEEVPGEDPEVLARYYRDNYSVLLEPPGNPLVPFTIKQQTDIWEEIIHDLTIPPPGTPPRRPRADDATLRDSVGRSGDAESQALSVGPAPAPGSVPGSVSRAIIPGSGSQSDPSSDAVPPPPSAVGVGDKHRRRGGLRFTIRRRSESRQTKKNRRRRVIDVRI
jgi:hypothetical protein